MQGFYPAKVIDNNDTDKSGKVKIRIEHLHWGFNDEMLPWAISSSLSTGGSNSFGKSNIPEINSYVWVWFEDTDIMLRYPYYNSDLQFESYHPHVLFDSNIKSKIGSIGNYPNIKFTYYKNGICIGVDSSSNKEIFVYHSTGVYFLINNSGEVHIHALGNTLIMNNSEVNINNGNLVVAI